MKGREEGGAEDGNGVLLTETDAFEEPGEHYGETDSADTACSCDDSHGESALVLEVLTY